MILRALAYLLGAIYVGVVAIPLVVPGPLTPFVAWFLAFIAWQINDDAIDLAMRARGRSISWIELIPVIVAGQIALDHVVPALGSSLVVIGQLGAIRRILRHRPLPAAYVRRTRAVRGVR